ncbi:diacylglycerol/lipid kinase family protein [Pseudoclavibacter helvolus]|uniref:diacylglycerol/lipid kinase family protein n=1 Tax=Pseudoclavibacter helvolus TaxID=255205 RepID=UPI003C76B334
MVNPVAGLGASSGLGRRLAGGAGASSSPDLEVVLVAAGSLEELRARAASVLAGQDPPEVLVVQGGDGMVSMGASLVAGTGIPLGIVPAGTGNDFARSAGLELGEPAESIERLLTALRTGSARVREVDVMRASVDGVERLAINSINVGFDALVNRRANELQRIPGTLRYLVALVDSVGRYSTSDFVLATDGSEPLRVSAELITILNGSTMGGGISMASQARIDDGVLDLVRVGGLTKLRLLAFFPLAMLGRHLRLSAVSLERVRSLHLEVPPGVLIYADGEELRGPGGGSCTLDVRIEPAGVRLVQPPDRG